MAIDLLNSFLQKGQNINTNSQNVSAEKGQSLPQNMQVMRAIRSLQAGQTLRGEIISVKGEDVQLAIMKDVIIDAKLAQSMNLSPGISMPFQVKANNQNGLSLVPLFTNTAVDPNAMKALDMAGLPINERSMEMVQNLMEKGMPIDKQTLQGTYRDVAMFKDYPVKDIISLRNLQMPVTADNLNQLSSYENNRHYLNDSFSEIGKAIGEQIKELIGQGNVQEVKGMIGQLQQLFRQNEGNVSMEQNVSMQNAETVNGSQEEIIPEDRSQTNALNGAAVLIEENIDSAESRKDVLDAGKQSVLEESKESIKNVIENRGSQSENTINSINDQKEGVLQKEVSWEELYRELEQGKDGNKAARLFEKIWKKEVSNQWNMEPEAVLDKEQVKKHYEKLNEGMKQLERILEATTSVKSPAVKAVRNTASNLDFMNQLHQMHTYLQLPLKMTGQNAHGELYVFSNKKNLTKQEGKVTALLHLDMEHLGKMDIYVALEDKKVSTNFYLEKEEYLDFIEANIDMLNSRLQKRGYECSIKASVRSAEEESVMNVIEKQQGQSILLSTQAFDVRA